MHRSDWPELFGMARTKESAQRYQTTLSTAILLAEVVGWERDYQFRTSNTACSSVCLFVRGKRQNYGTYLRQTLRNYEERYGKRPLRVEIARLSVLGEISRFFRFFVRGRPPFLLSSLPLSALASRRLTQRAFVKTVSTMRHVATVSSLRETSHLERKCYC